MTSFDEVFSTPLSADAVRATEFAIRRRGFDPDEVRIFLHHIANDIQGVDAERVALRTQLNAVRAELEQLRQGQGSQPPSAPPEREDEISVHAVDLLSQAQQIADNCVAEAQQYARDLIQAARSQYQDILHRAQQAAADSTRRLSDLPLDQASAPEIEYVRTYARVAQVQLRSVLDALTHEVDKLGQITDIDDYRPASSPAPDEFTWEPGNLVSLNASRTLAPEPGNSVEPYGGF